MPVYVALLRGINVGANKRIKMERLRQSFETLGFKRVQTYIQSGNVVFQGPKTAAGKLCKKIEEQIVKDFGFSAPVVVRNQDELASVIASNPFLKKSGGDGAKLHVIFLSEPPTSEALKALEGLTLQPDESSCRGGEIFLHLPNGMAKSSLMNNPVERKWLKGATARNWNTVNELLRMCQACR